MAAVLAPGVVWFQEATAAANCMDRGGSYNYSTGQCDFVQPHERILFVSRHGRLFVAAATAFLLGAVLVARGRSNLALLRPFRTAAEKRALLLCLSAGLAAIALGVISIAGDQPPWLNAGAWGRRGRDFWRAALILSLDVILVLVGCRGPRKVAIVVIAVLGSFLVLLAGWGLLVGCIVAVHEEKGIGLQYLMGLGLIGAVQWYCLRAVIDRLKESV
jgi:hypothetical protein